MLRRLLSYSAGLYAAAVLASLARVALRALIAKTAGKEALGAYAFYGTALAIGGSVLALGFRSSVTKLVASGGDERSHAPVVSAVLAVYAGVSVATAAVGAALFPVIDRVHLLALVTVGPVTLVELARSAFRGRFDQRREIGLVLAGVGVQALCVGSATLAFADPLAPVWGGAAGNLVMALVVVGHFVRRSPAAWRPAALGASLRSSAFRGLAALSVPIWISDVVGVVGHQADQVIVQGRLGYAVFAEYAAAFTFIGLLEQPLTILSRVSLVTFAGGHAAEVGAYRAAASLSLVLFSLLGLATVALAIPLTPLVFTEAYTLVPTLVAVLSLSIVLTSVEALNSSLTIARDYAQANRDAAIGSAAIYIPLALVLVGRAGVMGAAWSYVASWAAYAVIHGALMYRRLPEHAAVSVRAALTGTALYALAVAAIARSGTAWSLAVVAPAFLALGRLLGVWEPGPVLRLVRAALRREPPAGA